MRKMTMSAWLLVAMAVCGGGRVETAGQGAPSAASEVSIRSPADGTGAGREVVVKGRAQLKTGETAWLLARREDFDPVWWPQRAISVDPKTGEFSVSGTLGEAADVGHMFDVAVVTVNAAGHQLLTDYRTNALTSGEYKPIRLPNTTSPPRIVKVRKTSNR